MQGFDGFAALLTWYCGSCWLVVGRFVSAQKTEQFLPNIMMSCKKRAIKLHFHLFKVQESVRVDGPLARMKIIHYNLGM